MRTVSGRPVLAEMTGSHLAPGMDAATGMREALSLMARAA